MKKTYNEIMEKIELTDEMRERIFNNIQNIDLKKPAKVMKFHSYKKYLSIAACFIILLAGVIMLPNLFQRGEMEQPPKVLNPGSNIVEVASAKELSKMVGYEVKDLSVLPFEVTETTYMSYGKKMAEIIYSGDGQNAVYRMSIGDEDNSGDYNTYESVMELTANDRTVILKGHNDKYSLVVWKDEKYSYSIQISNGISQSEWLKVLNIH